MGDPSVFLADGDNALVKLDLSFNFGVNDLTLCHALSLLPELEELRVVSGRGVTNWFLHNWFKSGGVGCGADQVVGRRRKFAPLNLFCRGTRIAENQVRGKKNFPWTLDFKDVSYNKDG